MPIFPSLAVAPPSTASANAPTGISGAFESLLQSLGSNAPSLAPATSLDLSAPTADQAASSLSASGLAAESSPTPLLDGLRLASVLAAPSLPACGPGLELREQGPSHGATFPGLEPQSLAVTDLGLAGATGAPAGAARGAIEGRDLCSDQLPCALTENPDEQNEPARLESQGLPLALGALSAAGVRKGNQAAPLSTGPFEESPASPGKAGALEGENVPSQGQPDCDDSEAISEGFPRLPHLEVTPSQGDSKPRYLDVATEGGPRKPHHQVAPSQGQSKLDDVEGATSLEAKPAQELAFSQADSKIRTDGLRGSLQEPRELAEVTHAPPGQNFPLAGPIVCPSELASAAPMVPDQPLGGLAPAPGFDITPAASSQGPLAGQEPTSADEAPLADAGGNIEAAAQVPTQTVMESSERLPNEGSQKPGQTSSHQPEPRSEGLPESGKRSTRPELLAAKSRPKMEAPGHDDLASDHGGQVPMPALVSDEPSFLPPVAAQTAVEALAATAFESALLSGQASLSGQALLSCEASLSGQASLSGDALLSGQASPSGPASSPSIPGAGSSAFPAGSDEGQGDSIAAALSQEVARPASQAGRQDPSLASGTAAPGTPSPPLEPATVIPGNTSGNLQSSEGSSLLPTLTGKQNSPSHPVRGGGESRPPSSEFTADPSARSMDIKAPLESVVPSGGIPESDAVMGSHQSGSHLERPPTSARSPEPEVARPPGSTGLTPAGSLPSSGLPIASLEHVPTRFLARLLGGLGTVTAQPAEAAPPTAIPVPVTVAPGPEVVAPTPAPSTPASVQSPSDEAASVSWEALRLAASPAEVPSKHDSSRQPGRTAGQSPRAGFLAHLTATDWERGPQGLPKESQVVPPVSAEPVTHEDLDRFLRGSWKSVELSEPPRPEGSGSGSGTGVALEAADRLPESEHETLVNRSENALRLAEMRAEPGRRRGQEVLHLQLEPEKLGPLRVTLRAESGPDGGVSTFVTAPNVESARALERAASHLAMSEAGLTIQVDAGASEGRGWADSQGRGEQPRRQGDGAAEQPLTERTPSAPAQRRGLYA